MDKVHVASNSEFLMTLSNVIPSYSPVLLVIFGIYISVFEHNDSSSPDKATPSKQYFGLHAKVSNMFVTCSVSQ
jgi:hypothetical protein